MSSGFGERLRLIREKTGLTKIEFARRIDRSAGLISHLESSDKVNPKPETVDEICKAFGINAEWLISGKGEMVTTDSPLLTFDETELKDRIKATRKKEGLTQAAFAEKIGCSKDQIKAIEQGKTRASERLLKQISVIFNVSFDWLRSGYERKEDNLKQIHSFVDRNKKVQKLLWEIMNGDENLIDDTIAYVLQKRNKKDAESS